MNRERRLFRFGSRQSVQQLDPKNGQALYYASLAEQQEGHADRARGMWKKALASLSADDPLAVVVRGQLGSNAGKGR